MRGYRNPSRTRFRPTVVLETVRAHIAAGDGVYELESARREIYRELTGGQFDWSDAATLRQITGVLQDITLIFRSDSPARALTGGITGALAAYPPGTLHDGAWCYFAAS